MQAVGGLEPSNSSLVALNVRGNEVQAFSSGMGPALMLGPNVTGSRVR